MAKERGLCKYYIAHHQCTKGKEAETLGLCQHCPKWAKAGRPVRKDLRKQKREKQIKKERWD